MSTTARLEWTGGGIKDSDVSSTADIAATKLIHQFPIAVELFEAATTVVAVTRWLHMVQGSTGSIVEFNAAIAVVADDASRTITIDLQKCLGSNPAGGFSTVLTSTIDIDNTTAVRTPVVAVVSDEDLAVGDILEAIVTVAGGSGNQAKGLTLVLTLQEST